jgi:transposase
MDESGIDFDTCHRKWGRIRNSRGRPKRIRRYTTKRRANLISCIGLSGVVSFDITEGLTETNKFNDYILNLIYKIPKGSALILDNASFHRCETLLATIEMCGRFLLFLPPYSPDLNPIEISYGWLKRMLKQSLIGSSTFNDLILMIANIYSSITKELCVAWYDRCFYLDSDFTLLLEE